MSSTGEKTPEMPSPGPEGLGGRIDPPKVDFPPYLGPGGFEYRPRRNLSQWGVFLGKLISILAITGATAWNGITAYLAEEIMRGRQTQVEVSAASRAEEIALIKTNEYGEVSDEQYKMLSRTVNVHTDKLINIERSIKRINKLMDYVDWKYSTDEKKYGARNLERMIFHEPNHEAQLDQEELILRIVAEMASHQEKKRGRKIELPKKAHHIPESLGFYK
jgi:hypothetical protein